MKDQQIKPDRGGASHELMTVPEAAAYLRQSTRKTWEDIRVRRLPSIKLGGRVILRRTDVDEALTRLTRAAAGK